MDGIAGPAYFPSPPQTSSEGRQTARPSPPNPPHNTSPEEPQTAEPPSMAVVQTPCTHHKAGCGIYNFFLPFFPFRLRVLSPSGLRPFNSTQYSSKENSL